MLTKWLFSCVILLIGISTNGQNIKKAKVLSVPLYVTSTFRISCSQFDKSFIKEKKEVLLTEANVLKKIEGYLPMFKPTKLTGIDVRGKLIICYRGGGDKIICFDEFGHFFKDGIFYENHDLFNFLLLKNIIAY